MIIEIPAASDFVDSGRSLLNLAWDAVSTLYLDLENSDVKGWDDDGEVTDEFWEAAQRPLANAVAIAQQGVEFLLWVAALLGGGSTAGIAQASGGQAFPWSLSAAAVLLLLQLRRYMSRL